MSDVSGIPYMGPMGQGNFFAPQFSYNPQINPTAGYAGPVAYNQNVTNNLYSSGGGFGTQTAYYAGLGASYGRQISPSDENPYAFGGVPASLAYPGATLSGGYTTGPANMPSFDTGPNFGYTSGGAGALDLSQVGNPFSGGLGGGGGYSGPTIDWSNVGRAAADPYSGMSMPGGLGSPMGGSSGASPFNWSDLWGGGGGHTSGIAPDTTGGRAPSVDWNNISSPPTNYGTFQGGGTGGYSSGIAPDTSGGRDFEWPTAEPASGMAMPGGLGSPMTMPQETTKSQDQAPFDLSGPTTGWNNAPASMPNSERLLGYDPQKGPVDFDPNTFVSPSTNYDMFQAPAQGGGGGGTDKIVEEARERLAGIIGSPETAKAVESPATDYSKFQQPGTAAADALRPPDKIDISMEGRKEALETLRKELQAQDLFMTSGYRDAKHPLTGAYTGSAHAQALAFDARARTPEQADATMGKIRELMGARGMVEGRDYKILDEVRSPSGHATGPHIHTELTPEGMQRYQESAYDVNRGQVTPRPPADIPPQGPLPPERPQPLPEGTSRPPAGVFPEARLAPNGQEPTAFVVHHTEGRPTLEATVADWKANRPGIGSQYFLDRNGVVHDVKAETGYEGTNQTRTGNVQGAKDLNNSNVVGIEISAKNGADMTPKQIAALQQFVEQRYSQTPVYGHSEIDKDKNNAEGIARANEILDARVAANPNMFPSPGFWDQLAEQTKPAALPSDMPRPSAEVGTPFVNDGTPFGPPAPPDYKPPAPAPVKHSGLELARANIDTPIEKIAMERGGQKAVDQISSMAIGKTPRELLASYGGMFMSRAEPLFGSLGITRQDFEKAITMPQTRQDLKMRFADFPVGGSGRPIEDDSWTPQQGTPAWNEQVYQPSDQRGVMHRDETVSDQRWSEFRRSDNVEDRRNEQLTSAELSALKARGFGYAPMSEPAPSPMSRDLGLGDLPTPRGATASAAPRFFGSDENAAGSEADLAARNIVPSELSMDDWGRQVYEASDRPLMARDESLGPDPNPFKDFRQSTNIEDRRFDPALTDEQRYELAHLWPGAGEGVWVETDAERNAPVAGGKLAEMLGSKDLSQLEADTTMRQAADTFAPRAVGTGGDEAATFNERLGPFGDISMRDFQSPSTDHSTFQQLTPIPAWQASLPPGRNGPEVVEAVKAMAARLRTDPAEIAALVQQETHDSPSALWNPQITPNRYGYRGLTQMGRDTFTDAARSGMPIGSFPTIEDYQRGTAEQQIAAYGDWLDLYTLQNPQGAAAFVNSGGLAGLPPGEAAAVLQGTQFAPNAAGWVRAFEQGNRDMPTTATRQAPELRSKSINDMTAAARSHMAAWPQQQLWSDYNMPRRPGGY